MAGKIIPDDLITTINDFKSTSNGQMINIHGKEYASVAHRVAVLRRNLGAKLCITTEVVSIDENTVGKLVGSSAADGKKINKDIKIGVCGEHAGDPKSIKFLNTLDIDYISCSPFRIPTARLAAAQAEIS